MYRSDFIPYFDLYTCNKFKDVMWHKKEDSHDTQRK